MDPAARVAVTAALQRFAGGRFDTLTGTKTVAKLTAMQGTDTDGWVFHLVDPLTALAPGNPGCSQRWEHPRYGRLRPSCTVQWSKP
eukprot:1184774-Prorocentrum_minimum.AAC.1